jgi:glycosyltransferase involved in cell wall biosynthesis
VTYRGELPHKDVKTTFGSYELFYFPTLGENFGHVIAESLSSSCPVLCLDTTPWTDTLRSGGGFVTKSGSRVDIAVAVDSLGALGTAERMALRLRAGQAYNDWYASQDKDHVFTKLPVQQGGAQ